MLCALVTDRVVCEIEFRKCLYGMMNVPTIEMDEMTTLLYFSADPGRGTVLVDRWFRCRLDWVQSASCAKWGKQKSERNARDEDTTRFSWRALHRCSATSMPIRLRSRLSVLSACIWWWTNDRMGRFQKHASQCFSIEHQQDTVRLVRRWYYPLVSRWRVPIWNSQQTVEWENRESR